MNNRKVLKVSTAVMLFMAALFALKFFWKPEGLDAKQVIQALHITEILPRQEQVVLNQSVGLDSAHTRQAPAVSEQTVVTDTRTDKDRQISHRWIELNGYDPAEVKRYRDLYSHDQLKQMGIQGDVVAWQAIISNMIAQGWGRNEIWPVVEQGIILGSRVAITTAINLSSPGVSKHYSENPELLDALDDSKEALAYMRFAEMRGAGGLNVVERERQWVFNNLTDVYGDKGKLNDADLQWVETRAMELYSRFESKRQELGLGAFDNRVPKEVTDFYGK